MLSRVGILMALMAIAFLGSCTTALYLSNDGEADPISGHQVGIGDPESIVDLGDIRVRFSPIVTVRKHPIPPTYAFGFSWTPEAYDRRNAEKGRRAPTQQDWDNEAARAIQGGMRASRVPGIIRYRKRMAARSEFKPYVAPDGSIKGCNDTWGGKYGCTIGLTLSKPAQLRLAREVVARLRPTCRIGRVDPAEVLALRPGTIRSGRLRIVASLACP